MLDHLNNMESMHRHILIVFVKLLHIISYCYYEYLLLQINEARQYHNFLRYYFVWLSLWFEIGWFVRSTKLQVHDCLANGTHLFEAHVISNKVIGFKWCIIKQETQAAGITTKRVVPQRQENKITSL